MNLKGHDCRDFLISLLVLLTVALILAGSQRAEADILSDFSQSAEDWKVVDLADTYDAGPYTNILVVPYDPKWISKAGPVAGSIYHLDTPDDSFYFSAPAKFLGDVSWSYNSLLTYELRSGNGPTGDWYSEADIILTGTNNVVLVTHTYPFPLQTWATNSTLMNETLWQKNSFNGPNPTRAELLEVLAGVKSFWIRGEYYNGYDSSYLDNVQLHGSNEPRRAFATASITSGRVTGIHLIDPGYGYTSVPTVTLAGMSNSPAGALAKLTGKTIGEITLVNTGEGYTGQVYVQIEPPPRLPSLTAEFGAELILTAVVWAGLNYRIQDSEDLKTWNTLDELVAIRDSITLSFKPIATSRFFRIVEIH